MEDVPYNSRKAKRMVYLGVVLFAGLEHSTNMFNKCSTAIYKLGAAAVDRIHTMGYVAQDNPMCVIDETSGIYTDFDTTSTTPISRLEQKYFVADIADDNYLEHVIDTWQRRA